MYKTHLVVLHLLVIFVWLCLLCLWESWFADDGRKGWKFRLLLGINIWSYCISFQLQLHFSLVNQVQVTLSEFFWLNEPTISSKQTFFIIVGESTCADASCCSASAANNRRFRAKYFGCSITASWWMEDEVLCEENFDSRSSESPARLSCGWWWSFEEDLLPFLMILEWDEWCDRSNLAERSRSISFSR